MLDLIRVDGSTYERWQRFSVLFRSQYRDLLLPLSIYDTDWDQNDKRKHWKFICVAFVYLFITKWKTEMHVCVNCWARVYRTYAIVHNILLRMNSLFFFYSIHTILFLWLKILNNKMCTAKRLMDQRGRHFCSFRYGDDDSNDMGVKIKCENVWFLFY